MVKFLIRSDTPRRGDVYVRGIFFTLISHIKYTYVTYGSHTVQERISGNSNKNDPMMIVWKIVNRIGCQGVIARSEKRDCHYSVLVPVQQS